MNKNPGKDGGRRGFLISGLRTLILGGLAGICGALGKREPRSAEGETLCALAAPCRDCPELHDCLDPKAAASKQDKPQMLD